MGARAGTLTLLVVANPTKRHILRQLIDGPKHVSDIREEDGSPAEISIETNDVLAKITPAGREMLFVSFVLERWLLNAPLGPLRHGSKAANIAIAALVSGWASTTMHTLAAGPMSAEEVNDALDIGSAGAVNDHLEAMEGCKLLARPGGGRRFAVTDWLREGIAPLAAAARLERRQGTPDTAPIDQHDVRAAFQLTLPLLRMPTAVSGTCFMAARMRSLGLPTMAGVEVRVEEGRIASCRTRHEGAGTDARVIGTPAAWLDATIEGTKGKVAMAGDNKLASALVTGLHDRLFGLPVIEEP